MLQLCGGAEFFTRGAEFFTTWNSLARESDRVMLLAWSLEKGLAGALKLISVLPPKRFSGDTTKQHQPS